MSGYLLDTNIVSDVLKNPDGKTAMRMLNAGIDRIGISVIALAELRYGIARKPSGQFASRLQELLRLLTVFSFEAPADEIYGELRTALEKNGKIIGPNDLFIAAHALSLDRILVTDNEREFSRIENLRVENWLR